MTVSNIKLWRLAAKAAFLAIAISFAAPSASYAQLKNEDLPYRRGIKIGDIKFHGAFNLDEEVESNVFLSDSNTKLDLINSVSPSVGVEIPFKGRKNLSLDYEANAYLYSVYNSQNHIDHRARGLFTIRPTTRHKITFKDTYRVFTDRSADENSVRLERLTNDFRMGALAELGKLHFDIGYSNNIESYDAKDIYYQMLTYEEKSTISNIVDLTASYRFMPKTWALLEQDIGFITYNQSSIPPGSYYLETLVGLKGQPRKKIIINLRGGIRFQDYDKSEVINDKGYIGFVVRGGLDFFITSNDLIYLGLERNIYESTYQNMNYYNSNVVSVKYRRKLRNKVFLSVFGEYQLNLYPGETTENGVTAKREDSILGAGASVRYDIKRWLSVEGKYEYRQKISKFDVFDYIDNRVTARGTVGF